MTQLYGVIGDPVSHSLSPAIHNRWMREAGLDARYMALEVAREDLAVSLPTLEKQGAFGLNVTLPHKEYILQYVASISPAVSEIRAANTLIRQKDGTWSAYNTDVEGFFGGLGAVYSGTLGDAQIVILGAGGAARAVLYALKGKYRKLIICNRTIEKAEQLITNFGLAKAAAAPFSEYHTLTGAADIVVNTTSMGHFGETLKLPDGDGRLLFDLSYGAAADAMLQAANQRGWKTEDGLNMLVLQAARAFKLWFGINPDTEDALDRCRHLLRSVTS